MKKYWKLIVGIIFLIGGVGNFPVNIGVALVGVAIGAAFSVWWYFTDRKLEAGTAKKTGLTFVGSKDSNRYHRPTCPYASNIPSNKQIWFKTKAEAEKRGYKPCEKCRLS